MTIRKPTAQRQGHNDPGTPKALALVGRAAVVPESIPKPPAGLSANTVRLWNLAWSSEVAATWDRESDIGLIERLFASVDAYGRLRRTIRKAPFVDGSEGQPRLSPAYQALALESRIIAASEIALGMSPSARLKLGLLGLTGALTAQALNALTGPVDVPEEYRDEFEPA